MEIQELIARGRLLFSGAPKRFEVFNLINGRRSAKDIARKTGKPLTSTLHDLQKMRDMGLILPRKDKQGKIFKKEKSIIYEKVPAIRHLPKTYFEDSTKVVKTYERKRAIGKSAARTIKGPALPTKSSILDICRNGEDQLYEFKRAGTEMRTLSKEICAFANTKLGGLIFYGVEDDGTIAGTDRRRQQFDQSIQNSIRNTISPPPVINIVEKDVLGQRIIIIKIPAWNRKDVYHYERRVCIRKGTNVFYATVEESKKLHKGEFVI